MRKFLVKTPIFRCKVKDHHDKETIWIGYAESEDDLKNQLQGYKEIIRIKSFDLAKWQTRAQRETENVIKWRGQNGNKQTGEYKWRDTVWKYLKSYLFSVTKGKCAFCETDALIVSPGDVEHYRPKAAVDGDTQHNGYYWLAYNLENYLPSCGNCNSSGKMNKFPVSGTRAYGPSDNLEDEKPDLLNPFDDKDDPPHKHLEFVVDIDNSLGTVGAKTHRGKQTIEILGLNRAQLVSSRSKETLLFLQKLEAESAKEAAAEQLGLNQSLVSDFITKFRTEGAEYYEAKTAALRSWVKRWEERQEAKRKALKQAMDLENP